MAPTVETMNYHTRSPQSTESGQNSYLTNGDMDDGASVKSVSHLARSASHPLKMSTSLKNLKENEAKFRMEFFKKEPCLYSHKIFQHAAVIFNALKHEKEEDNAYLKRKRGEQKKDKTPEIPHIDFENAKEKRLAFELAFSALKCE